MRHAGQEFGYVLTGRLTIHVGFDTHRLGPGDSISFPATTPHRLGNDGTEPATAIWCILGRHLSNPVQQHLTTAARWRTPEVHRDEEMAMGIRTYGPNAVDWEERVDVDRLRTERLARLKESLDRSELGALLSFDFHNIRYMTSTHIGTWAMDKLIRFALLPRGGEPVVWDFGSAARHHQLYNPWLDGRPAEPEQGRARAGISTLRGASTRPPASPRVAAKIKRELEKHGLASSRSGSTWPSCPSFPPWRRPGCEWSTASRCSWTRAGSRPPTRSPS